MNVQEAPPAPCSPRERYRHDLAQGRIRPDPAQAEALERLQSLHEALRDWRERRRGLLARLRRTLGTSAAPPRGLYLWGGVGRGKTYLMDLFFHCQPGGRQLRMHFHRFMRMAHQRLNARRGEKDPLARVAAGIAREADLICFDEFFVSDIGDAMILANLLEALFAEGVVLVATSNIEPARLYENGLQRQRFLPAIALIERHCEVLNVDGGTDWRLRSLEKAEIYHSPLGPGAEALMQASFRDLSAGLEAEEGAVLEILGRPVKARCLAEDLVWFEFRELCGGPRSAADYIEIAQLFHTVLLSNLPVLDAAADDAARRFISLVDEFYDHGVKLIVSAAAPLESLYRGRDLAFAFERTRSRLLEMQSHEYLVRPHRP